MNRAALMTVGGVSVAVLVAMGGVCLCRGDSGEAASTPPPSTIPEIVVTALRMTQDVHSVPYTAYRLGAQAAEAQEGVRTTPDALKGVPSVMVQKTAYGQGSPFLRGFTGFRTLCLVDGIRLNNSVFRDGPNQYWNTVDPLSIGDYELVMGPVSVLYGSDAVGGVMNALTGEPPEYRGESDWERRLFYRGASAERSSVGRVQVGGRVSEEIGFTGGVTLKDFGDLEGGRDVGTQEHTGYAEQDYDARLDYHLDKSARLTLAHQTVIQDDAWRTHKTIYGIDWEGLAIGDDKVHSFDQHRDLTYARYRDLDLQGLFDTLDLTVSRQRQAEDLRRVKKDSTGEDQGFDVETWGSTIQAESDAASGEWVYGIEYYRDGVDSYSRKYKASGALDKIGIQGPVADDATYDSLGAYVQDTVRLLDGGLDVTPGVRYTYGRADAEKVKDPISGKAMSVEGDWDAVVGSLRFLHPLAADRSHVLFAGVSQGFRAPNLSDLTRLDTARSTEIETPVSDLDPERYVAYEAGLKSRFERLSVALTYYYTVIDSMIVRTPTGRTVDDLMEVTKKNSGDGYVQGVELSGRYAFSRAVSSWLTGSWMDGKVDAYPTSSPEQEREYISRLMPITAQAGTRWQIRDGKYWVEGVCDAADRADKLSADDRRDTQRIPPGGTPGYAVFTARAGWRPVTGVELALAVENLADTDYRIHGSGVNEPGRNVVLTADVKF